MITFTLTSNEYLALVQRVVQLEKQLSITQAECTRLLEENRSLLEDMGKAWDDDEDYK